MADEVFDHTWATEDGRRKHLAHMLEFDVCIGSDIDVRFQRYSGRGMMGKYCVAITGSNTDCRKAVAQLQFTVARLMMDEVAADPGCKDDLDNLMFPIFEDIMSYKTDSMGYDVTCYWELWTLDEDEACREG